MLKRLICIFLALSFVFFACSDSDDNGENAESEFSVSFDSQGGTEYSPQVGSLRNPITLPTPIRKNYVFVGWFSDPEKGEEIECPFTPASDTTIFAQWTMQEFTVSFDANGGEVEPSSRTENVGTSVTLPVPIRKDYIFVGWFSTPYNGEEIECPFTLAGDTTIFAQWTMEQFTLTFNANGGIVDTSSLSENIKTSVVLPTPTREGFTFNGWFTAASGGSQIISPHTLVDNVTLFAQWTERFTINFNATGGEVSPSSLTDDAQTVINLPTPSRNQFSFIGWFTSISGGTQIISPHILVENLTLFARWTQNPVVSFNLNGGVGNSSTVSKALLPGEKASRPSSDPTRNGFVFDNWYSAQTGGEVFDFDSPITSNTTIWARWTQQFTVNFNANGGEVTPNSQAVNAGEVIELPIPSRETYFFDGWFTAISGGTQVSSPHTVSGNITLFARWIAGRTVSFNLVGGNGNSTTAPQAFLQGSVFTPTRPAENPTKAGFVFDNWYASLESNVLFDFDAPITQSDTVFARWLFPAGYDGEVRTISCIEVVFVAPGTFAQGGSAFGGSTPREVTLTRGFWIGKYPVTQAQYLAVMGNNPSSFGGRPDNPVENVTWFNARDFVSQLGGRLPTEAQWEFAARGGNKSQGFTHSGSNDADEVAWHSGNRPTASTQPVGQLLSNELGIYDMSGNVWEWVSDRWGSMTTAAVTDPTGPATGSSRVLRGGSWNSHASDARVATRSSNGPSVVWNNNGFRIVFGSD
jgi:uncharacterized repeat protein (TIGR02543 family)